MNIIPTNDEIYENETEEERKDRLELYALIEAGLEDVRQGRTIPLDEAFDEIFKELDEKFPSNNCC